MIEVDDGANLLALYIALYEEILFGGQEAGQEKAARKRRVE